MADTQPTIPVVVITPPSDSAASCAPEVADTQATKPDFLAPPLDSPQHLAPRTLDAQSKRRLSRSSRLFSLLLEPFPLQDRTIDLMAYVGGTDAGFTFKVRIAGKKYVLKTYMFDNVISYPARISRRRQVDADYFFVESRAQGSLAQRGLNGKIFPFCYGWIDVPDHVQFQMGRRFGISTDWNRPDFLKDQPPRGILFEWIDAVSLSPTSLTPNIASQAHALLAELHRAKIVWRGMAAANFLVQDPTSDHATLRLWDSNKSRILPHYKWTGKDLEDMQQRELDDLEEGLALLSQEQGQGSSLSQLPDGGKNIKVPEWTRNIWFPKYHRTMS